MQQTIARIASLPRLCEAVAPLAQASCGRRSGPGLCERQGDFSREPIGAQIKAHLTLELANHIFHDACAEPAVRGRRDGRPPDSTQRKLSLPSSVRDHAISTQPTAADSDPYFAALVASSCKEIAVVWAVLSSSIATGPSIRTRASFPRCKAKAPARPDGEARLPPSGIPRTAYGPLRAR